MQSNVSIGANVLYAGSRKNVSRYPRDFKVCCKLPSGARFQSGNGFFLLRAALRELHNSVQTCWASWKRIWLPFCLCKLLSKLVRDPPAKNNMRSDPKQGARREHMWSKVWEASVRLPKSQSLAAKSLASVQKYFHSGGSVSISNATILRKLPETHSYFRKSKIGTWGASNGSVWQRILSLGRGTSRSPRKPFFTPTSGFFATFQGYQSSGCLFKFIIPLKETFTYPVVALPVYEICKYLHNKTTPWHDQRLKVKVRIKRGIFSLISPLTVCAFASQPSKTSPP